MLTIDRTTGIVTWDRIVIRSGMSPADFERQGAAPGRPSTMNIPERAPVNPVMRGLLNSLFPGQMDKTDEAYKAESARQRGMMLHELPPTSADGHTIRGRVTFVNGILDQLDFTFRLPEDERGWAGYSIANEFKRHNMGLTLLEAQLGAPHEVQNNTQGAFLFRGTRYQFAWGAVRSDFDTRGGGTEIVIQYSPATH